MSRRLSKTEIAEIAKLRGVGLHTDHSLVSRRDFMASGLLNFSVAMAAPSMLTLALSRAAQAACPAPVGQTNLPVPIIALKLSGGPATFTMGIPRDQGLAPLNNYGMLGMGLGSDIGNQSANLYGQSHFDRNRVAATNVANAGAALATNALGAGSVGYIGGFHRLDLAAAQRAAVTMHHGFTTGLKFCGPSNDDTANNMQNAVGLLQSLGVVGSHMPWIQSGYSHDDAYLASTSPLNGNNVADLNRALLPSGVLGTNYTAAQRRTVFDSIMNFGRRQLASLSSERLNAPIVTTVAEALGCSESAIRSSLAAGAPAFDNPNDAELQAIWGANLANAGTRERFVAGSVMACILGMTPFVGLGVGGRDYHNLGTGRDGQLLADFNDGILISRILETLHRKSPVGGVLIVDADGAVGQANTTALDQVYTQDRGTGASWNVFFVHPATGVAAATVPTGGVNPLLSAADNQVGFFLQTQSACRGVQDGFDVAGWNLPQKQAASGLLNIMAFSARMRANPAIYSNFTNTFRVGGSGLAQIFTDSAEINRLLKVSTT